METIITKQFISDYWNIFLRSHTASDNKQKKKKKKSKGEKSEKIAFILFFFILNIFVRRQWNVNGLKVVNDLEPICEYSLNPPTHEKGKKICQNACWWVTEHVLMTSEWWYNRKRIYSSRKLQNRMSNKHICTIHYVCDPQKSACQVGDTFGLGFDSFRLYSCAIFKWDFVVIFKCCSNYQVSKKKKIFTAVWYWWDSYKRN